MEEFEYRALHEIKVNRETRQRRVIDPGDLTDSIRRIGVLNPLIVRREGMVLIAGERRLRAATEAGLEKVPVRFFEDLTEIEAQVIELEENLKRSDLPWQDEAKAIAKLHQIYQASKPDWTQEKTANAIGISDSTVSKCVRVLEDLHNPQVAAATSLNQAHNFLSRKDDRSFSALMGDLEEASAAVVPITEPQPEGTAEPQQASAFTPPLRLEDQHILHADFTKWIETYSGPKFNFVHCDFPYGIKVFSGPQAGVEAYDDSPEVYWKLVETFCKHLDRFMTPQAHLMFWLAGDIEIQAQTLARFRALAPMLAFQTYPLYWIKSDNAGILPDPKRGPRRVVETALIASREDRLIAKAVANAYSAPTDKAHHPSTKPEPMLRFFFQMFVDESSSVFDPTCGSGAALRAAESLGARRVLGLEIDEEHCLAARAALRQFRSKQSLARAV